MPKVSVATCTYNRPDLLRRAIESLRAQTDPDWEHLIFDNGSTDLRVAEVLAWAKGDSRVRVFRSLVNRDQPAVFWNNLFDQALGRYFTTLDDDNEKLPRFVEAMAGELDRDLSLDLVTSGFVVRIAGREDWEHHHNLEATPEIVAERSTCEGGAVMYRRETFERVGYFSEEIWTNEDWEWLRRAVRCLRLRVKNLPECHVVYYQHEDNRQRRAEQLGHAADVKQVRAVTFSDKIRVRLVRPPDDRITDSQRDVIAGVFRALRAIPWVADGDDVALVVAPFRIDPEEAKECVSGCGKVIFFHIEDPYAFRANVHRVSAVRSTGAEVWVATNDATCALRYAELVERRVITCPSLSADSVFSFEYSGAKDVDVLLCGYAYPSRKRFVFELLPLLQDLRVVLVGNGWAGQPSECYPTLPLAETYRWHMRARAVVCAHRVRGDCSDGPDDPRTVNRGYLEGYCGARVFLDRSRGHHHLEEGDVVWYDGPRDLAVSLRDYLSESSSERADWFRQKCRMLYTYRTRVARVINCVRAPRYLAEIP